MIDGLTPYFVRSHPTFRWAVEREGEAFPGFDAVFRSCSHIALWIRRRRRAITDARSCVSVLLLPIALASRVRITKINIDNPAAGCQ